MVTADFDVQWYEEQINKNQRTIMIACSLFLAISILVTFLLTSQYSRVIETIKGNLGDLA